MTTNETARSRGMSLVWPAVFRVVRLLLTAGRPMRIQIVPAMSRLWGGDFVPVRLCAQQSVSGLIGWLWFVSAAGSFWRAVSFGAVLALAALIGITWYLSRARADRRWRAALDAYAKQEQAKRAYSRRNFHARPQSQNRGTNRGAAL